MLTRCPYQACLRVFETSNPRTDQCPDCGRAIGILPLDVWLHIDRQCTFKETDNRLANASALANRLNAAAPFVAVVEDVRSLWNVGSIFRSADGAGIDLLVLCGITGTPPRKEIAKTSLGAEETVDWLYAPSTADLLPALKSAGYQLLALEYTNGIESIADSTPLADELALKHLRTPICMVVGNEVGGLSRHTLEVCDLICHLPMRGVKESLNVAVAFGIAAYMLAEVGARSGTPV